MKKIMASAGIFIVVFLISVAIFFPYNQIVQTAIDRYIKLNNLQISYSDIDSGLFRTGISQVELRTRNGIYYAGDIYLKYSPLSLITKRVSMRIDSPYGEINAANKKNTVEAHGIIYLDKVAQIFKMPLEGGTVELSLNYDYIEKLGSFSIESTAFIYNSFMNFTVENASVRGEINNEDIKITSVQVDGMQQIKGSGIVKINRNDLSRSAVSGSGEAIIMGVKSRLSVTGTIQNPNFSLK